MLMATKCCGFTLEVSYICHFEDDLNRTKSRDLPYSSPLRAKYSILIKQFPSLFLVDICNRYRYILLYRFNYLKFLKKQELGQLKDPCRYFLPSSFR